MSNSAELVHADGASYFVDPVSHTCCRLDANGGEDVAAGRRGTAGFADGPAGTSRLCRPSSCFLPPTGGGGGGEALFIIDTGNSALRRLDLRTGLLSTVTATPRAGPPLCRSSPELHGRKGKGE